MHETGGCAKAVPGREVRFRMLAREGADGYCYSQFCRHYHQWVRPTMRQVHRAGEKAFIDFSGKRPVITDAATGELTVVELFVSVLGEQLCLRRGVFHPGSARLDHRPRADGGVLRRDSRRVRP